MCSSSMTIPCSRVDRIAWLANGRLVVSNLRLDDAWILFVWEVSDLTEGVSNVRLPDCY
jgi:hypothetical protein